MKTTLCYPVSVQAYGGKNIGPIKARFPYNWDELTPEIRYTYTRNEAVVFLNNCNELTLDLLKELRTARMSIYSGDWEHHLDEGIAGLHITAQQMMDIFVDKWNHRDLS